MLDNRKIRIMTKLACFEKNEGKKDLKRGRFYKNDYVRLQGLKSIAGVTFAYLVIIAMFVSYYLEYFIEKAVQINYKELLSTVLFGYVVVIIIYITISHIKAVIEYERSRRHLKRYYQNLKDLHTLYRDEAVEVRENRE